MPMPNTNGVEPSNEDKFNEIEPGWYQVKIEKHKERISAKGNAWLKLWLKSNGFKGYAWLDVSLNPKNLGKLKLLKDCLGLPDNTEDPDALIDGEIWAYCFTDADGYGSVSKIANLKEKPPALEGEKIFENDDLPF